MKGGNGALDGMAFLSFATVGGGATVLYLALALAGSALGMTAAFSSLLAYAVSATFSYAGHRILTFRSRAPVSETAPRFVVLALLQYAVALALPAALADYAGLHPAYAYVGVCVLVPLTSLLVMSRCVFRPSSAADHRAEATPVADREAQSELQPKCPGATAERRTAS